MPITDHEFHGRLLMAKSIEVWHRDEAISDHERMMLQRWLFPATDGREDNAFQRVGVCYEYAMRLKDDTTKTYIDPRRYPSGDDELSS